MSCANISMSWQDMGEVNQALADGIEAVFDDGRYSDFIINCGHKEWRVHRLVICSQSEFSKKVCDSSFEEAKQGYITLTEDEPEVVEAMLRFFYKSRYDDLGFDDNPLLFNMKVHILAEKYFVDDLKLKAKEHFIESFDSNDKDALSWLGDAAKMAFAARNENCKSCKIFRGQILETVLFLKNDLLLGDIREDFRNIVSDSPGFIMEYAKALAAEAVINNRSARRRSSFRLRHLAQSLDGTSDAA